MNGRNIVPINCHMSIFLFLFADLQDDYLSTKDLPTLMIVVLVRNKAHVLPHFFGCLENLTYPKNKISLFIRSDHNADNSLGK